ncbi:hypothetical protein IJI69_00340 [Candidatus Saccharibacteria bacterium]|nr:hypothetical protein [Candidatus Saccharibacteria bacterium]MBQ6127137.1 hypothetical protein [Candidatus Saccharibacteria bacterium]
MGYFKEIDENGNIICLLSYDYPVVIENERIIEISEKTYNELLEQLQPEDEPEPPEPSDEDDITGAELLSMVEGIL